ncbi:MULTISPECIES: hypothetical protein [Streptomyces]|uniref:Uncharacterized protein n=2 Tax=Streptomyces TaxID=1883 RepID=A0ABU4JZH3_9ACTN|nr:hypothetical protein [Streptomyces roseolus]MDX2290901.1 hypothetical protein [Streptomyces roseolus]
MEFKLVCDTESLDLARSGSVWGNIWVEISGLAFPEPHWNDMPVAFLAELLDAVAHVRSGDGDRRRVRFFDGPFWLDLVGRENGGTLEVTVNASGTSGARVVAVDAQEAARSLAAVRDELVRACLQRGWGDQMDVRRLQAR